MDEDRDATEGAPEPDAEDLEELDLVDPLKREEDMPGLDPVVPIPPE